MISELENKDYLYSKSKVFNKYFVDREKTATEKSKEAELLNMILNFYRKVYDKNVETLNYDMFDYDMRNFGYIDDYGYYVIKYDDWKYYLVNSYGEDVYEIFTSIVKSILRRKSDANISKNRKEIYKEYSKRFGNIKNFDSIYVAEYDLEKWNIYFDEHIPGELISMYESYVNDNYYMLKVNISLEYNPIYKKFTIASNNKKRSLKK